MDQLEINFSPRDTVSHLLHVLKVNMESLYYGLKLIENDSEIPERLKNDNDFLHLQFGDPLPENDLKIKLKQILLSKCFEDLVKGMTLSLNDAYTLINYRLLLCKRKALTPEKIISGHKKIYKKSHGMNFLGLIKEITDAVQKEILYSKELETINRARNCFVHRQGIVYQEKDINSKEENTLTVRWLRPFLYKTKGDEEIEMINGGIVTSETPAHLKFKGQKKSFKPDDVLTFSYREITEIAYTFYLFASDLVKCQIQFLKDNPI